MREILKRSLVITCFVLTSACASKKYIVTMPQKDVSDELATKTIEPCVATSKTDADSCVLQINDCPHGLSRVKIVRNGRNLDVTPYCFVPPPEDPNSADPSGEPPVEDPGDL